MLKSRFGLMAMMLLLSLAGCGGPERPAAPRARKAAAGASRQRTVDSRRGQRATPSNAQRQASAQSDRPCVVLHTTQGDITLRLDPRRAPRTVARFLHFVDVGHYDGTIFHQVVEGCMVLGGAFTANLREKPVPATIPNEADNGLSNRRGTIAMARPLEEPHGATCQFFINLRDNPALDHRDNSPAGYGYCVFGEVVSGFDVLERIANVEVQSGGDFELLPIQTVRIESASRVR